MYINVRMQHKPGYEQDKRTACKRGQTCPSYLEAVLDRSGFAKHKQEAGLQTVRVLSQNHSGQVSR